MHVDYTHMSRCTGGRAVREDCVSVVSPESRIEPEAAPELCTALTLSLAQATTH